MEKIKKGYGIGALAVVAVAFLIAGVFLSAGFDMTEESSAKSFWKENGSKKVAAPEIPTLADLAERLAPAVVNISTTNTIKSRELAPPEGFKGPFEDFFGEDFFKRFFDEGRPDLKSNSLGSGFIINEDGFIITNYHVIADASEVIVKLSGKKHEYKAKVIGKDEKLDLALIKIEAENHLPVVTLGDSDKLRIGDWVMAIGNPFGLGGTVTAGIVSQKGREIGAGPYDDFIQTDASINPGNSGGPLFNLSGEVIGINTAIAARAQGIGFTIPINAAKDILLQLKEKGSITRGWIGVTIQELTADLSDHFGIKDGKGVLISSVVKGDPADKAGIRAGDIIVEFNGTRIENLNQLPRTVAATTPGQSVKVKVIRDGKEKVLSLKVAKKPGDEAVVAKSGNNGEVLEKWLGITVKAITKSILERFGLESATTGVLISKVDMGSPAASVEIKAGDIIQEVNKMPVADMEGYRKAMKAADRGKILLLILRGKNIFYVSIVTGE